MVRRTPVVCFFVLALAVPWISAHGVARADPLPIEIGTELQATTQVRLHQAEIAKGSRVSVIRLLMRGGRLEGVRVELADGHVVMVTLAQVRSYFRVVSNESHPRSGIRFRSQ